MAFIRSFSESNINLMTQFGSVDTTKCKLLFEPYGKRYIKVKAECNAALFAMLKNDIYAGIVFPAIRNDELHYYYKGGCLFKFVKGAFFRNANYENYSEGTQGLSTYEKAKKQNENKYSKTDGESKERKLLDELYCYTFGTQHNSSVVVLDIEVNLGVGQVLKCDLALFNTVTREIMFVEGKVYRDARVRSRIDTGIEVITQVNAYTDAIVKQSDTILLQYANYVKLINGLFGTNYVAPIKLVHHAKLLVYDTGGGKQENVDYTIRTVNHNLGEDNVMWVERGVRPTIEQIWDALRGE